MKLSFILSALLVSAAVSFAADAPKKPAAEKSKATPEELFKNADKNNDGKISKEEFVAGKKDPAAAEKVFTSKDKDKDGFLSPEEFAAKPEGKKPKVK